MNFRNANSLNNRVNLLSGNLLPIEDSDSKFPLSWRVHNVVIWLIELIHTVALVFGLILVPREKALNDGTVCVVVLMEASFMLSRLYARRKLLSRVVDTLDSILREADETMKDLVRSTLSPITKMFTVYCLVSVTTITIWTVQPVTIAFDKGAFFYVDYNLPAAFTSEPFSRGVLIASSVVMTIGSVFLFLKKFGVDVYMMHIVLILTVQYRYIGRKLTLLFRDLQGDNRVDGLCDKRFHLKADWRTKRELRALCQHHNTVLRISIMLKKLLSVNFSLLYVNSVFRFCFISILMSTVPSMNLSEGISVLLFAFGSAMQFFLLCFSVQTLSDASTEITDTAFNENWYQYGSSIKRIFLLLIMTNNLECKIAAIEKFNLSLPSFMTIMNQSYSIALLFLRAN
ncbi:odorant receptor 67c-like isoform X2 [Harpegnathos saltator]|uniref:odorant receptor 67c-like isoform X2 n=1 Tax=Harpegnathos saltator TaxID=610380 RepID=UPI000948AB8F|nr:odorant receptor 67c-like isoform X2 [Harpegnathos saltator]